MSNNPVFSIIIPTYNRADKIVATIQSALDQTYDSFEVLIIDDGSTDNTQSVVEAIADDRVKYHLKDNAERGAARNFGIDKAIGKYVTFIDSDDLFYKHHLETAINLFKESDHKVIHLGYELVDPESKTLLRYDNRVGSINDLLIQGNILSCIGIFAERSVFSEFKFSEIRSLSGSEDYLIWLQIASKYPFGHSNEVTSCMIQHDERSVMNFSFEDLKTRIDLLLEMIHGDKSIAKFYGSRLKIINTNVRYYQALHAIMAGHRIGGLKIAFAAGLQTPSLLFNKKFLAMTKIALIG